MLTRCIICRRDEPTRDREFVAPVSGDDTRPVLIRGYICEDCDVVNWAYPPKEN